MIGKIIYSLGMKTGFPFLNDTLYLKLMTKCRFGISANLDKPQTFSDKIQWLKLHDRCEDYVQMVDKLQAKEYVKKVLHSDKYIIPTLGVWNSFDEIDFNKLPNQFVLKTNHDSGGVVICRNKTSFDRKKAQNILNKSLKRNYYFIAREWAYKKVAPKIFAESYLENGEEGLHDYKIWCFDGKPMYIQYITGRIGKETYEAFYDTEWKKQDFYFHNKLLEDEVQRPVHLKELLWGAERLSAGHKFLRVDFYVLESGEIKFGECTFFPMGGSKHSSLKMLMKNWAV